MFNNPISKLIVGTVYFLFFVGLILSFTGATLISVPVEFSQGINYFFGVLYRFDFMLPVSIILQLFFYIVLTDFVLISLQVILFFWNKFRGSIQGFTP